MSCSKEVWELLNSSPIFDEKWYLENFADVSLTGVSPLEHFIRIGTVLGRNPGPDFDLSWYLEQYSDVRDSGMNPLAHYTKHGHYEGREIKDVSGHYLSGSIDPENLKVRRYDAFWNKERENIFLRRIEKIYAENSSYFDQLRLSVVMPTYNRADRIVASVSSVIAQSHPNWQLLIVDDGSTDNTAEVLEEQLKDSRIHYEKTLQSGVSAARNRGLELAKGEFVFYLDSDNLWTPDCLRNMIVFMIEGNLDAAYSGVELKDDKGVTKGFRGDNFSWQECIKQNYVDLNAFGHTAKAIGNELFDTSLRRLVDWDLIIRITRHQRTAYAPFLGVTYHDGESGNRITKTEYTQDALLVLQAAIREKYGSGDELNRLRPELNPRWNEIVMGYARLSPIDRAARKFISLHNSMVDWEDLATGCHERVTGLVSIVVLCFNQDDLTKNCLQSIIENTGTQIPYEVIAIDNASSDGTENLLVDFSRKYDNFSYHSMPENLMFSLGNDIGVAHSSGQYVVLLNNDTVVTEKWLENLIEPLVNDRRIGAVGPKLLYEDGTLQCGGIVFNNLSKIPYHLYRHFPGDHAAVNKARYLQAITGACMAMRASDFVTLKGLDPTYINGCEDLDLCFRLNRYRGLRVFYNPQSVVYHLEGKSEGRGKYISRNRAVFVKHWSSQVLADDSAIYEEDQFEVTGYSKPGTEPDGATAAYVPELIDKATGTAAARGYVSGAQQSSTETGSGTLNIGFSTMWYARGIAFHSLQLARALEGEDFKTHIFARWESDRFENQGAIYHKRVTNAGDDPSPSMAVEWARKNNLDAMIFMEVHPNDWKRVTALREAGVYVICYENLDVLRTENWSKYEIFDAFLFNASYVRDIVTSRFPEHPALLIPWGTVPPDTPQPQLDKERSSVRFVHVAGWGGLNNRKNSDLLLRSFYAAEAPGAELHFYTQVPIEKYGDACAEIARNDSRVFVYEGTIENIYDAYIGMDMLLWPSKREGLGLPIVESLVSGLPVLVTDGWMMKQWIVPGKHGVLCPASPQHDRMFLPEMQVDEQVLSKLIASLADDPASIRAMRDAVDRDRKLWLWDWQPAVFREQLAKMVNNRNYRPSSSLDYLPEHVSTLIDLNRS
jgi:GT2 family glycosyltransferase/glycosyltransferase involved in cell wall biosynthesis